MPHAVRDQLLLREPAGILLIRRRYTWGQVIDDLQLIWDASTADEYRDRIEYLPL